MELKPYQAVDAEEIADAYSAQVLGVPHCHAVSAADFHAGIGGLPLRDRAQIVTRDRGAVVGFVDAGVAELDGEAVGAIPFLWYERGRRAVGQKLLDAAEEHLRHAGGEHVQAFPQEYRYPFYHLKAAYLSDRLGHVAALLVFNGYRRTRGEVFLDWPECEVEAPPAFATPMEISLEFPVGKGRLPGVTVRASLDGEEVGVCENKSCGEFSRAEAAQDWLFTTWLGVQDAAQGRGLGKYLLLRALHEMHEVGYRHAVISTALENHRAYLFYSNCGYHTVDWTYGFTRSLT